MSLVGKAYSQLIIDKKIANMVSCRAVLEGRALNVKTGEIVASDSIQISTLDFSEKLSRKRALKKVGGELGKIFSQKIANIMIKKPIIEMIISDINKDEYLVLIEKLKKNRNIENIYLREISKNIARLEIETEKKTENLKELIENMEGISLKVVEFTQEKMYLKNTFATTMIKILGVNFQEFMKFYTELSENEEIEITDKKYNQNDSFIKLNFKNDIFILMNKFS